MKVKAKESGEVNEPADRKKWDRKHREPFQSRKERPLPLRLEGRKTRLLRWIEAEELVRWGNSHMKDLNLGKQRTWKE